MTNKIKRLFLFLIVAFEIFVGGLLLYKHYLSINQKQIITVLSPNITEIIENSKLNYFYELKANSIELVSPEWLEERAIYTNNKDGLHERYNYEVEKRDDVFRIITIGDSFTFGHYINTYQNWTELLEDELNSDNKLCSGKTFEVINLGVGGYDSAYIIERYRLKGQKYNPDLIVWFESGSGFYRNKELEEPLVRECSRNNEKIKENWLVYGECFYQAEKKITEKYGLEGLAEINNSNYSSFFDLIGSKKVIFFGFEESSLEERYKKALVLRKEKYPFMDFRQVIPEIDDQKLLDGHPSIDGHKTIKNQVLKSIKQDLVEMCN